MTARWLPLVALTVLGIPATASAAPWISSGAVVHGDFDDDGNEETVVSSPEADGNEGSVYVIDSAAGTATRWTRDSSGLAGGGAASGDYFGAALAVGDFDGDDYDDLVVGTPGADDSGETDSGSIHVIYGSWVGLTTTGDQVFHQDTTGIDGVAEDGDQVGDALAVGDFNCDGYDDIAIGVPEEAVGSTDAAGAAQVLYGSSGGISTVDDIYTQGMGGNGAVEAGDHFGGALAVGNFNGDDDSGRPCHDLVIASPDEDAGSTADVGYVWQILGSTAGLTTSGALAWYQDTTGVEDVAEADDRFGLRMRALDTNSDGYDDLLIAVPGDSCIEGHGEALHRFLGSSTGITLSDDELACTTYLCNIDTYEDVYGCHSSSPPVHASDGAELINMSIGDDVVHAAGENDRVTGHHGNDVLFGGAGSDILDGGPGLDIMIGGAGDDVFVIDLDCEVQAGEVIDGGPGDNEIHSHLTRAELLAAGVTIRSADIVAIPEGVGSCVQGPLQEGQNVRPQVTLTWDDLPDPDSVFSFTSGTLDLTVDNISDEALTVDLTFQLTVRGWTVEHTPSSISLTALASDTYELDLEDFIPTGIDPQNVPAATLELPTSGVLRVRADVTVSSPLDGLSAFAPDVFGHLEGGDTAVLYREKALEQTYYGGDLRAWRLQIPHTPGRGRVVHARAVVSAE